jgi:hypothetical protein
MANRTLTNDLIAKTAVRILENELGIAKAVYRGYEDEFDKKVNGYEPGDTISIRRPTDFTVRDGAVAAIQDVTEGKTSIVVNKQKGVDFKFTSVQRTLEIGDLAERVIRPAMVQLANQVDADVFSLFSSVPNWVGTPGEVINSYTDFAKIPQNMDERAVPSDMRSAFLSPADHWGLLGSQTSLYMSDVAKGAYRKGSLGEIGGVDTFMAQNVPTLTVGSRTGSILVDLSITTSTISYNDVKDTNVQTIHIDALGGATQTIKAGEVFTIADVYDVNPVTKARLPFLKQFVVTADAVGSGSECDLIISPAMIWTGAFKNIDVSSGTDLNDKAVTFMGTASTPYRQNLAFHKNAFALVMVPLVDPEGAVKCTRESFGGVSARMISYYDGTNDVSNCRLDILYGVKTIDGRLAVRASGTA